MNKYQEALLELGEYTVVLSWSKNQTCSINELNEFKLLQELVDKATPKKLIISSYDEFGCVDFYEHYYCPNCKNKVDIELHELKDIDITIDMIKEMFANANDDIE